jgi:hypothetical protein
MKVKIENPYRVIVCPKIEDIDLFYSISSKSDNDLTNRLRENILECILNIRMNAEDHFTDPTYGEKWVDVRDKFRTSLEKLCQEKFTRIDLCKKAGRMYNYDFDVKFINETDNCKTIVQKNCIEFKYNCTSISNLPQILQLTEVSNKFITTTSYAEFYYLNYLDEYINCDEDLISFEKPSLNDYLREIIKSDIHYCKIPLIVKMKQNYEKNQEKKFDIVNKSIKTYLETNIENFDMKLLSEKLEYSQKNKVFVLWGNNDFVVEKIDETSVNITSVTGIVNDNTIVVESDKYKYKLLLRWKNGKGILNTAWQISIKNK